MSAHVEIWTFLVYSSVH